MILIPISSSEQIPNPFLLETMGPITTFMFIQKVGVDIVNTYLNHPEVVKFLSSGEKFDVCVIETFNSDAFLVRIRITF